MNMELKKRILIIDDDILLCQVLSMTLKKQGYHVESAYDGSVGVVKYQEHPADLVITDIFMPEKEGLATITELKQMDPNVSIIAMSGGGMSNETKYLQVARVMGAKKTFVKPFQMEKLLDTIEDILGV